MNGRTVELPAELEAKYASELEQVRKSEFWNTPMTKAKLAPLTEREWELALKAVQESREKSQ